MVREAEIRRLSGEDVVVLAREHHAILVLDVDAAAVNARDAVRLEVLFDEGGIRVERELVHRIPLRPVSASGIEVAAERIDGRHDPNFVALRALREGTRMQIVDARRNQKLDGRVARGEQGQGECNRNGDGG